MAYRLRLVGGGGGGIAGGCVLGTSFELPLLFLLASSPFKLGRFFWSISSSSSSDSESIRVITNCFGWTEDRLIDSVSESEISTDFSDGPTSSTKWNWSISSFKDSREDAISSSAATGASRGTCCKGIMSEEGFAKWEVWREEDHLEPRNLAWIRQYGLSEDLLLGWRDLSFERSVK